MKHQEQKMVPGMAQLKILLDRYPKKAKKYQNILITLYVLTFILILYFYPKRPILSIKWNDNHKQNKRHW